MGHHLLLLLLLFLVHCFGSVSKVESLDASTDRDALLSFKSKISDPTNSLSGWTQNSSHCTWYGVKCSVRGARVQALSLPGLGLFGSLPPQISNLSSLYMLDLSNNLLYGQIPTSFSRLSLLQHILLANNSIDGTIPVTLADCPNLRDIQLQLNKLTGHLPPELGHLQKLEILDISVNNLTGVIPPTFGNLSSLTFLALARNQLLGKIPSELGHLHNIRQIQLSANQFSGDFPVAICNISSLIFLSLTQNNLTGKLPIDIGTALPNLRQLFLAQNSLEGTIPSSISNASQIQHLDLSHNGFVGSIPLFGDMHNLTKLNLGRNHLSSSTAQNFQLIASLKNCTKLEILKLFGNQLAGNLPASIANLSTYLQEFCVDDNMLTGSFPQGVEKFDNLISLSIETNSFTGELPKTIGNLKKLQKLTLYQNAFYGDIPDVFANLTQLYVLAMGYNQFSGRIPASIGNSQLLVMLGLHANRLNGSIPLEIFGLSSLNSLRLAQNALSGTLPAEVENLKQLQSLDVSDNQLSGNLTATISFCSSLHTLMMARNNITGPIPSSLGKLASLESLDLSSNNLSGPIPGELEKLQYLMKLNLSFNHLEGEVPTKGVFMNISRDALQGNNRLCSDNQEIEGKLWLPHCIKKESRSHLLLKIIVPIAAATFLISIMLFFVMAWMSRQKQKKRKKGSSLAAPLKGLAPTISYFDIQLATENFAAENKIGKGGFGTVYKAVFNTSENGTYTSETTLAVKVLDLQQSKAAKSFEAECGALKNVRHRNLVKVITSCSSIDQKGQEFKALVMEFMSNGNLDKWLYPADSEAGLNLTLLQRLNIAIDVASAMDYLHHDCDPPIVHCDLKPGNVLLDDDMVAHVGDFGLARFLSPSQNDSSTIELKGSIGYIAPEYGLGGKASTYGDVYSFGILVIEMFTAKKPTDGMFQEGLSLNKFASAVNENQVLEIADPRLFTDDGCSTQSTNTTHFSGGNSSSSSNSYQQYKGEESVAGLIRVGLSCAAPSAKERLTMREALVKLHDIKKFMLRL